MKIAELCAGYGGLSMAIGQLDPTARLTWYAEVDPDASEVLAHHHPDAPNHGDITNVISDPNAANRMAGNGVVPAQAAAAIRRLLGRAGLDALPADQVEAVA